MTPMKANINNTVIAYIWTYYRTYALEVNVPYCTEWGLTADGAPMCEAEDVVTEDRRGLSQ